METWLRRRGTLLTLDGFHAAGGVVGAIAQSAEHAYERSTTPNARGSPAVPAARDTRRRHARHAPPPLVGRDRRRQDPRRRRHAGERATAHGRRPWRRDRARDAHPDLAATAGLDRREPRRPPHAPADHPGREPSGTRRTAIRTCSSAARRSRRRSIGATTPTSGSPSCRPRSSTRAAAREAEEAAAAAAEAPSPARAPRSRSRRCRSSRSRPLAASVVAFARAAAVAGQGGRGRGSVRPRARDPGRVARADAPKLALLLAAESAARLEPITAEAQKAIVTARRGARRVGHRPELEPIPVGDVLTTLFTRTDRRSSPARATAPSSSGTRDRASRPRRSSGPTEASRKRRSIRAVAGWSRSAPTASGAGTSSEHRREGELVDGPRERCGPWRSPPTARGSHRRGERRRADLRHRPWTRVGEPFTAAVDFLSVAFTLDGQRVLAGTGDGRVFIWDVAQQRVAGSPIAAHGTNDVWELVMHPDGDRVATASSDGTAASGRSTARSLPTPFVDVRV